MKTLAVIILNWNRPDDTIECIESIKYDNSIKIIVVDNGSTDDSINKIKTRFPDIIIVENKTNSGFGEGNNIGIKKAKELYNPNYYFLLNNDTVVKNDTIKLILDFIEINPEAGIIGPKILNYYSKEKIWSAGGEIKLWKGWVKNRGEGETDTGQYNKTEQVNFISGCAMIVKKEVIETVGYFDKDYFTYFEDADLCIRAIKHGYSILYYYKPEVYHKCSTTCGCEYGELQSYYRLRNRLLFIRKNTGPLCFLFFFIFIFPLIFFRDIFRYLRRRKIKELKKVIEGVIDFLCG